jgi:plastocyanin
MRVEALVTAALLLSVAGCSKSTPSDSAPPAIPPATVAAASTTPESATVTGKVAAGAIVVLEPAEPREFPPGEQPMMDQVSLSFTPDLLFVRTGQPVDFRNSDDTLHNVHVGNVDTREPAFNVAIPTGEKWAYTFTKDGFYHVGCDIHPSMSAEILAVSTPFVMVSAGDGSFSFADVPPGAYRVRVHAAGVRTERAVEIKAGVNAITVGS